MFEPVEYEDAGPATRAVYDAICAQRKLLTPPNWARYLGASPEVLEGVWAYIQSCEHHLPPLLRQLLLFAVSRHNQAEYCLQYHGHLILELTNGLDYDDLVALCDGQSRAVIPDDYQLAVQITLEQLAGKCLWAPDALARLEGAGFSDAEVREIVAVSSLGHLLNALTMAANVPVDDAYRIRGFRL